MLRAFLANVFAASILISASALAWAQLPPVIRTVKGIVVDEQGKPAGGAEAMLGFRMRPEEKIVQADAEGRFSLEVRLDGNAPMVVARTADGSRQGVVPLPDEAKDWKDEEVRVVLKPAVKLTAKVTNIEGVGVEQATACLLLSYEKYRPLKVVGKTNAEGVAAWMVPAGWENGSMFALKSGDGIAMLNLGKSGPASAAPGETIVLKLEGARSIALKAIDEDGKPMPGVRVGASYLSKPGLIAGQGTSANLSYFGNELDVLAKDDGTATFDWLPKGVGHVSFWAMLENFDHARRDIDLQMESPDTTLRMKKLVSVKGKVLMADGKPAIDAEVRLVGDGYEDSGAHHTTKTDQEGKFEFQVAPDLLCMIGAQKETQIAKPVDALVTARNQSVEGLVLQLEPGRRVFGKVTQGKEKKPYPGQTVAVRHEGRQVSQIPEISLPNPTKSNKGIWLMFIQYATTNDKGEFEVYCSASTHTVILQSGAALFEKIDLSNEVEKEVNLHRELPPTIPFRGQVNMKETGIGVAGALISFAYEDQKALNWTEANSAADGGFQVERAPFPAKVFAISADGKYADLQSISDSDAKTEFALRPTATLRGRALDGATGEPLADKQVEYGIRVEIRYQGSVMYSLRFGNRIRTNKEGYFETGPVAIGVENEISIQPDDSGRVPTLAKVAPMKAGLIDLGDLKVAPPPRQETTMDRVLKVFDRREAPIARFEMALTDAKLTRQRVAVFFANPEEGVAKELMLMRYDDRELARALDPYVFVCIDLRGDALAGAKALAKRMNLEGEIAAESPRLVLIDLDESKLEDALVSKQFFRDGKVDKLKIIDLLNEHRFEPLDAQKLLDEALAQAKREGKRVLVQETATWCGPCWMLSRFLDKHRAKWEKDIIWVKMDHRWTGAQEIMQKLRTSKFGGVPWWAILDEEGNVLITSNRPSDEANVGFPSGKEWSPHFKAMMQKAARRMTEKEIEAMTEELAKAE